MHLSHAFEMCLKTIAVLNLKNPQKRGNLYHRKEQNVPFSCNDIKTLNRLFKLNPILL